MGRGADSRRLSPCRVLLATVWIALLSFGFSGRAQAARPLLHESVVQGASAPGTLESACGLALLPGAPLPSGVYISNYYNHGVDVFVPGTASQPNPPEEGFFHFQSRISFDPLDGPCQLALAPSGALYANDWHEGVSRVLPSVLSFDSNESTGVAVDPGSGRVYANDRTYVAVYEPSGAPVQNAEGRPLHIGVDPASGESSLKDAYGLAVSGGRIYVADAGENVIKVYEPSVDPANPVLSIDGHEIVQRGFHSLVDATVSVDPSNGHLLVVDNLQPGFEHPEAVIDEFEANGTFLGQLSRRVIDGGPSGMAFEGGNLYVTSGNTDGSKVLEFGPYVGSEGGALRESAAPSVTSSSSADDGAGAIEGPRPANPQASEVQSQAVIVQHGGIKVSFDGQLTPQKLPRDHLAPVRVSVGAKIIPADESDPPKLRTISIAINRYGHFDSTGLPLCTERDIQPATTQNALRACRSSLVGAGSFRAKVALSEQSPFPSEGKMYAFNARIGGKPAILAHVYGTEPVPTSFTFPFLLRPTKGTFGTVMTAKLPSATGKDSYITSLAMNLGRNFSYRGRRHSYLSASCPAPKGLHRAPFSLAHAEFSFKEGRTLGSTLVRSCGVRG